MSMKILLFAIVFSMSCFSQKLELVHKTDGIIWGIDMVDESNLVFTNRDGRAKYSTGYEKFPKTFKKFVDELNKLFETKIAYWD